MATLPSDEDVIGRVADLNDSELLASLNQAESRLQSGGDDDLIASLQAAEAKLNDPVDRFMAEVRRPPPAEPTEQDRLREELWQERWGRKDTPETVLTRAGLGIGSAGGELLKSAGGVIAAAPTGIDFIPGTRKMRERLGQAAMRKGAEIAQEYKELGEASGVRGGTLSDIAQTGTTMALANAPSVAAIPFGMPAAVLTGMSQQFGSTYNDALQHYKDPLKAKAVAAASAAITGLTTLGFGKTGFEADPVGFGKGVVNVLKEVGKQGFMEGLEEAADQVGQSILQRLTYRPDMTIEQAFKEVILAFGAGGVFGSGVRGGIETGVAAAQTLDNELQSRRLDETVEEAGRTFVPTARTAPGLPEKRNVAPTIDGWTIKPPVPGGFPQAIELTQGGVQPGQPALSVYVPVDASPEQMRAAIDRKIREQAGPPVEAPPQVQPVEQVTPPNIFGVEEITTEAPVPGEELKPGYEQQRTYGRAYSFIALPNGRIFSGPFHPAIVDYMVGIGLVEPNRGFDSVHGIVKPDGSTEITRASGTDAGLAGAYGAVGKLRESLARQAQPKYQPGPVQQGQGAASLGVPLQRPGETTFTTAMGSQYVLHQDGTTTRNKAPRIGHPDSGPQDRSERTFFVSPDDANKLGEFQVQGGPTKIVSQLPDGRFGVQYVNGKDAGKWEARTIITPKTSPAVGDMPVELWNGGRVVHFGNPITAIKEGAPVAPPQEPDPKTSFAEQVTPPSQRGRILTSQPASYSVDIPPPGARGRQLETAPPTGPDRTPLPRAYPGLVEEAQRARQRTLPQPEGTSPTAHMLRAQLTTRMGESTVPGQPGFEPSTQRTTPPEDVRRGSKTAAVRAVENQNNALGLINDLAADVIEGKKTIELARGMARMAGLPEEMVDQFIADKRNAKDPGQSVIDEKARLAKPKGKMATRVKKTAAPSEKPTKISDKPTPAPAPQPTPAQSVTTPLTNDRVVFPLRAAPAESGWQGWVDKHGRRVETVPDPNNPGRQIYQLVPGQQMVEVYPPQESGGKTSPAPAPKKAKKSGDKMGDLMERIAKREATTPKPAPTTAPARPTTPVVTPPRFELPPAEPVEKTEADVTPASDRILAQAGMSAADIANATEKIRRQANLGFAMVAGKWQKVTGPIYADLQQQVQTLNGKRLRQINLVRDYAQKNNLTSDSVLHGVTLDTLLNVKGNPDITFGKWLQEMERRIKTSHAYLDGVSAQRQKAMSGLEGFIAGTKGEKWADAAIAEGQKRLNVGLDPVMLAAYTVKGLAMLERGIRTAVEFSAEMITQFGETVRPHLDRIWENVQRVEGDEQARAEAINLVRMKAASLLTAQLPAVQEFVSQIKAETAVRNMRGQKPVLTGEALDRQRAWDAVASHPFVRSQFVGPVEKLTEAATATEEQLQNYYDFKSDPNSTPVEVSGAAGMAVNRLDSFYNAYHQLRNGYEGRLKGLQTKLEGAIEAHAETKGEVDVLNQLLEDFISIGKEMHRQQRDLGAIRAFRKALGHKAAIRNVLGFIARDVDLSKRTADTPAEIMRLIEEAAAPQLTPEKPFESVVGATRDVIKDVADYVAVSEPLRARLTEGHDFLVDVSKEIPVSKFKSELAKLVKAGHFDAALRLFVSGVGSTATEKATTAKAANFFKSAVRKTLIDIEALQKVMAMAQQVEQSPEFRQLAAEAYGDLGVKEVMRGINGTTLVLHPIYDEEPTVISFDTDKSTSAGNLQALKDYRDRALSYISDPQAEGWDPRRAAALQAFLDDADQWLDPSINPEAGKFVEAIPRRVYRTIFGFLGRPDLIPQFALDRTAGPASELAHKTLNAYQTMQEQKTSILKVHLPKLQKALDQALKSHGIEGDLETYRDQVFAPLAASMQYFEGTPLRVGQQIGNGQTVTSEDINYYHEVRAFEKHVMNTAGGVGERAFRIIQQNPGGILYKQGGKTYARMPHETGPGTIHRRLRGRMARYADEWYKARTPEQKIEVLDRNVDRLVFGYLVDVANPKFNFNYTYGKELRSILAEARNGNPVGSFEDLVQRIVGRRDQEDEGDPETEGPEEVRSTLLREFGQLFDRYRSYNAQTEQVAEKSIVKAFGGENSFNTERGAQIVPGLWYDYGSVGLSERLGYLHNSTVKFAIEHTRAVEALERALSNLVRKFEERGVDNATTKKERDQGKEFYGWAEANRTLNDVRNYKEALEKALAFQVRVPEHLTGLDPHTQANVGLSFVVSSLLAGPTANIMNTFGGGLNITLFDQAIRNRNAISALAANGAKAAKRFTQDTLNLVATRDPVFNFLKDAKAAPLVGGMAEALFNYVQKQRDLYQKSRDIGLNLNVDLLNTLQSEWRWRHTGGIEAQTPQNKIAANVIKPLETMVRMATEALKQGTVGFVDSRLNTTAVKMTEDLEQDLMNRAIRYGELREKRALQEGRDPNDVTDLRNRFSADELVGGRLTGGPQAMRLRDLLRRYGGINVDASMLRFYQEWVKDGRKENHNLRMWDEPTRNQVALAISSDINQATFANRPIATRSSKAGANLGLFLGYPAYEMYKLAGLADRISTSGVSKGFAEKLPLLIGTALSMAVIGSLGVGLSEEARRALLNRQSPFPTIFNFNQTPKSYALTTLAGAMSLFPFYGAMVNAVTQRAYKTGYDLNSKIMVLNLATDVYRLLKEYYGSGQFLRPTSRFATRWTFPMNWVGPHLPIQSGLAEVSQARNSLSSAARQLGMEARLKDPFSSGDITYTKSTGPLNDFMNAVGNGDIPGAQEAFNDLVKVRQKEGDADPVMSAQRAVAARNPLTQIFGAKPTPQEIEQLFSVMREGDKARVQTVMRLFDTAVQSVGGRPVAFVQGARVSGGGGGGGSGGGGGTMAYGGPSAGSVTAPPAPRVMMGGGGAGSMSGFIGPAATFRIRTPRLGRRLKVGRFGRRRGKMRSRLRLRRRR